MLQYVAGILGFGFLGLSFLMLYLGYRTMQSVISNPGPDPASVGLCRFFLKISLIFMIFAGPLQWVTLYVNRPSRRSLSLSSSVYRSNGTLSSATLVLSEKGNSTQ